MIFFCESQKARAALAHPIFLHSKATRHKPNQLMVIQNILVSLRRFVAQDFIVRQFSTNTSHFKLLPHPETHEVLDVSILRSFRWLEVYFESQKQDGFRTGPSDSYCVDPGDMLKAHLNNSWSYKMLESIRHNWNNYTNKYYEMNWYGAKWDLIYLYSRATI